MPRDPSGVYSIPPGTHGITNTQISSSAYNTYVDDVAQDLNVPRPIVAGGTGASTASAAMTNLGGLPASGGNLTGDLAIKPASGDAILYVVKPTTADNALIEGLNGTHPRWTIALGDSTPETGGNAGSNFSIGRYSDSDVNLDYPIKIGRDTGTVTIGAGGLLCGGSLKSAADVYAYRSATPTQGVYYFGNATTNYLAYDGSTNFNLVGGSLNLTTGSASVTAASLVANTQVISGFGSTTDGIYRFGNNGTNYLQYTAGGYTLAAGSASNVDLTLNKAVSGRRSALFGATNGLSRWEMDLGDGTAESGSAAGSNFKLVSYSDAGANVAAPLMVYRASGVVTLGALASGTVDQTNAQVNFRYSGTVNGIVGRGMSAGTTNYCFVMLNSAGSNVGIISTNDTATTYATSSDERLKTDFQTFDAGPVIDSLQVYDFAWRATGARAHGVVAQQAVNVFPEAVLYSEAMDSWSVDYSKYVPLLLQEVKALRARVAQLEANP